jgi:hypothetical protein
MLSVEMSIASFVASNPDNHDEPRHYCCEPRLCFVGKWRVLSVDVPVVLKALRPTSRHESTSSRTYNHMRSLEKSEERLDGVGVVVGAVACSWSGLVCRLPEV